MQLSSDLCVLVDLESSAVVQPRTVSSKTVPVLALWDLETTCSIRSNRFTGGSTTATNVMIALRLSYGRIFKEISLRTAACFELCAAQRRAAGLVPGGSANSSAQIETNVNCPFVPKWCFFYVHKKLRLSQMLSIRTLSIVFCEDVPRSDELESWSKAGCFLKSFLLAPEVLCKPREVGRANGRWEAYEMRVQQRYEYKVPGILLALAMRNCRGRPRHAGVVVDSLVGSLPYSSTVI